MRRAYPSSSTTNRVVSTPPHSFSPCFGATGLVSAPPHLFPMCFDATGVGFDTTPPVSDVFQRDGGGFDITPFSTVVDTNGVVSTPPHTLPTCFDVMQVVSTPFLDVFRRDRGSFNTTPSVFDSFQHHPLPVCFRLLERNVRRNKRGYSPSRHVSILTGSAFFVRLLPFVSHTCQAQFLDLALLFPLYMLCILYLNCTKFS